MEGQIIRNDLTVLGTHTIEEELLLGLSTTVGADRTIEAIGSGADIDILLLSKGIGTLKTRSNYAIDIADDEDIINLEYHTGHLASKPTSSLLQAPTATEDLHSVVWDETNQEYTLIDLGGGITADNGVTKTGSNIQWGGPLVQNTDITGAFTVNVGTNADKITNFNVRASALVDVRGQGNSQLVTLGTGSIQLIGGTVSSYFIVNDDGAPIVRDNQAGADQRGLRGLVDYSANVTSTDYVQKSYTDSHLVGKTISSTLGNPTVTENNYVIIWDNTNLRFNLAAQSGGGGHVIEDSGTPLITRANLNFTNGLTASDNSPDTDVVLGGNSAIDILIENPGNANTFGVGGVDVFDTIYFSANTLAGLYAGTYSLNVEPTGITLGIPTSNTGDIWYRNSSGFVTRLAATATGNALLSGTAPSWGKIGLTTHVSGVLPIANGGTNSSTQNFWALSSQSNLLTSVVINGGAIYSIALGQATDELLSFDVLTIDDIALSAGNASTYFGGFNIDTATNELVIQSILNTSYQISTQIGGDVFDGGHYTITATGASITKKFSITGFDTYTINFGSDVIGDIYYRNSSGNLTRLAAGTATHVLTSNGAGVAPSYQAVTPTPAWLLASGGALTNPNTITGTGTNILKFVFNSLGVTPVNGAGHWLANTTAAAVGAQQISPSTVWEGQGWETTGGTSKSVKQKVDLLPVQGTAAGGRLRFQSSVDGGAYSSVMELGDNTALGQGNTWTGQNGHGITSTVSSTMLSLNAQGSSTGVVSLQSSGVQRNRIFFTNVLPTYFESGLGVGAMTANPSTFWVNGTSLFTGSIGDTVTANTRLDVRGIGTLTNNILRLADSANTERFTVRDNGTLIVPQSGLLRFGTDSNTYIASFGAGLINIQNGDIATAATSLNLRSRAFTATSGSVIAVQLSSAVLGFSVASGTANFTGLSLNHIYNTTATYVGTIIGIDYNPTLTSLTGADHIAFRATSGNILIGHTSLVSSSNKVEVRGVGTTTGKTLLLQNSSGTERFSFTDAGIMYHTVTPANDNALTDILVRDSGTGEIKYRTVASLPSGGSSSGATGEVQVSDGAGGFSSGLVTMITNATTLGLSGNTNTAYTIAMDSAAVTQMTLNINSGNAGTAGIAGGALTLRGGTGNTSGAGGRVTLQGGTAGASGGGGGITLTTANGGASGGSGGTFIITTGSGQSGNTSGGSMTTTLGNGFGTQSGGTFTITAGTGGATGTGGGAVLNGGAGGSTSGNGGSVGLQAGAATTTGAGGSASLVAGAGGATSGAGGVVNITAGSAVAGNSAGGNITLSSGAASGSSSAGIISLSAGAAGTTGAAGVVAISGGTGGSTSGAGGRVDIFGGDAQNSNSTGGAVNIEAGGASGTTASGAVNITGGNSNGSGTTSIGGAVNITGGLGGSVGGIGGAITIIGGAAGAGNTNGGSVTINGGAPSGSGVRGTITISNKTFLTGSATLAPVNLVALGSDPSSPADGDIAYVTGTGFRGRVAGAWITFGAGGGGSAHVIENNGTPLTARANLNFSNGLIASDNTPDTDVKFGGALTANTTISGAFAMNFGDTGLQISSFRAHATGAINVRSDSSTILIETGSGAITIGGNPLNLSSPTIVLGVLTSTIMRGITGDVSNPKGGDIIFKAGDAYTVGNNDGGDLYITYGVKNGTGKDGNIAFLGSSVSWQAMERGLFVGNAVTAPTGNPTGGSFLYGVSGDLRWRSSGGSIYTLKNEKTLTFAVGDSSPVSTGAKTKTRIVCPYTGTIVRWKLITDQSASVTLDVWKDASAIPTNANTITASAKPSTSGTEFNSSSTLTGWTTSVTEGDILELEVEANDNAEYIALMLVIEVTA